MIIFATLEKAVARAVADDAALMRARERWKELAGEVFDDEPLYEERAAAFLEWFTLDCAEDGGRPPIAAQLRAAEGLERAALHAIATVHHSVFAVREHVEGGVLLEDLWGGATFQVHERRRLIGLGPGEVFESRLVADVETPPRLVFSRTFCFHPREALGAIREHVAQSRAAGEARESLLFRLLRLRIRCERWRHVAPARIYAEPRSNA